MTRDWFDRQMARLMVLPFPPESIDEHWLAMRGVPPQVFEPAISHAVRTRARFPVPAELLLDCDVVGRGNRPQAVHPTSRTVPVEGTVTATIRNPFRDMDGKRGQDITIQVSETYRPDCDDCDDSGDVLFWCGEEPSARWPWLYRRACERRNPHGPHDWAAPCPCVATNATIQRRRANQTARYSQEPERVIR